jgi:hypothetical protein
MLWVKVLVAFMAAPGLVDVMLPAIILWKTGALRWPGLGVLQIVGLFFFAAGIAILAWVFHAFVYFVEF